MFSTDRRQFAAGAGVGADFYLKQRLVWRPDFELVAALKDWRELFPL